MEASSSSKPFWECVALEDVHDAPPHFCRGFYISDMLEVPSRYRESYNCQCLATTFAPFAVIVIAIGMMVILNVIVELS